MSDDNMEFNPSLKTEMNCRKLEREREKAKKQRRPAKDKVIHLCIDGALHCGNNAETCESSEYPEDVNCRMCMKSPVYVMTMAEVQILNDWGWDLQREAERS